MAVGAACGGVEVPASLVTPPFLGADTHTCLHTLREVRAQAGAHKGMREGNGVQGYILVGCCAL